MGTIKFVLGILVIVGMIMAGFQIIPPILANFSFQDDLRQIAVTGGANPNKTDEDLRQAVLSKAKEHDLTLLPNQVSVQRMSNPGLVAVYLSADYTVPVNLPGYTFTLHFNPSSGNKGF